MSEISLYVHIPFCVKKCAYCDFVSFTQHENISKYIDMLLQEAEEKSASFSNKKVKSIFIGGGTPSILDEKDISKLMSGIFKLFDVKKDAEISLEANPGTLDIGKLSTYISLNINRLSLGLQSADNGVLKTLGRIHTFEDYLASISLAFDTGFKNISTDLMFGVPGQSLKSFKDTLKKIVKLGLKHVSAYSLTLEEGTPMYEKYKVTDEDLDREMYHLAVSTLEENGFLQYETSNFAKKGYECAHNLVYWEGGEYLGLGVAAHSLLFTENGHIRRQNTRDLYRYLKGSYEDEGFTCFLTDEDILKEYLMLNLRLKKGIIFEDFFEKFKVDFKDKFKDAIEKSVSQGLLVVNDKSASPTLAGFDFQNTLIGKFF
ncbi:MAG: radical SAM family heme chaperone HemW [Eubacteriales bacterium]